LGRSQYSLFVGVISQSRQCSSKRRCLARTGVPVLGALGHPVRREATVALREMLAPLREHTLGLRRDELLEQRRKHLSLVKALRRLIELRAPEAEEARNLLQRMQQDSGEYASMTRAFLR
jgi:hypothetical protein